MVPPTRESACAAAEPAVRSASASTSSRGADSGGDEPLAVSVEDDGLAAAAAQLSRLDEPREPRVEFPVRRLGNKHRERVGFGLVRAGEFNLRHSRAMLAAPRIDSRAQTERSEQMGQTTQEFFDGLAAKADTSQTAGMNNSYAFDIEGAGQWTVKVADGAVAVEDGMADGADCTISTSRGGLREDRRGRAEPDERLHDRQAEAQGRHGRRDEAPEALPELGSERELGRLADAAVADPLVDRVRGRVREVGVEEAEAAAASARRPRAGQLGGEGGRVAAAAQLGRRVDRADADAVRRAAAPAGRARRPRRRPPTGAIPVCWEESRVVDGRPAAVSRPGPPSCSTSSAKAIHQRSTSSRSSIARALAARRAPRGSGTTSSSS